MSHSYHVRVEKERLSFCAAHFITYNRDVCEPLHGHNYHVAAEIHGPLDENYYVIDFIAVRDALQAVVDRLDHRVLLPTRHGSIHVVEQTSEFGDEVVATYGKRRWVFPRQDCALLPVENTTAELLAAHIGQELLQALKSETAAAPARIQIAVDECDGQVGVCDMRFE